MKKSFLFILIIFSLNSLNCQGTLSELEIPSILQGKEFYFFGSNYKMRTLAGVNEGNDQVLAGQMTVRFMENNFNITIDEAFSNHSYVSGYGGQRDTDLEKIHVAGINSFADGFKVINAESPFNIWGEDFTVGQEKNDKIIQSKSEAESAEYTLSLINPNVTYTNHMGNETNGSVSIHIKFDYVLAKPSELNMSIYYLEGKLNQYEFHDISILDQDITNGYIYP